MQSKVLYVYSFGLCPGTIQNHQSRIITGPNGLTWERLERNS